MAQQGVEKYGLTFASAEAEARARANVARERTAYVATKAPQVGPPDSWQQGRNSIRHTAGRLTDEERARRLAAMSADADAHDMQRWNRVQLEAQRPSGDVSLEQHAPSHHHSLKPQFLGEQEKLMFGGNHGGDGDATALADRIGARKHFQQRDGHAL